MAITKAFYDALDNKDIRKIRIMMKDSLLVDPSFKEFNEMERLSSKIGNIYETHDGRELIYDSSNWNDDYMNKLMVQVVSNFSRERVNHLKEVVRKLRPVTIKTAATLTNSNNYEDENVSYSERKRRDQANGNYHPEKVAVGAIFGAAAGGTIAAVASSPIIAGVVVGGVLGAGVGYAWSKGEK